MYRDQQGATLWDLATERPTPQCNRILALSWQDRSCRGQLRGTGEGGIPVTEGMWLSVVSYHICTDHPIFSWTPFSSTSRPSRNLYKREWARLLSLTDLWLLGSSHRHIGFPPYSPTTAPQTTSRLVCSSPWSCPHSPGSSLIPSRIIPAWLSAGGQRSLGVDLPWA